MTVATRPRKTFSDEEAHKLRIAGQFLQSTQWPGGPIKIRVPAGMSYPQAVQEIAAQLPPDLRRNLREWVKWVYDYETTGKPDTTEN